MTRNLRAMFSRVKPNPRPRTETPHETIARLERRNAALVQECLDQAGYIRFLTGKCMAFECAELVRRIERGLPV